MGGGTGPSPGLRTGRAWGMSDKSVKLMPEPAKAVIVVGSGGPGMAFCLSAII